VVAVADDVEATIYRNPLGVCGVITPWNYPVVTTHWLIVSVLMAGNAGQTCVSAERVFGDATIADAFEARVVELARDVKAGPWDADDVTYGPMVHAHQRDPVIGHIREALDEGATALLGGPDQPERYIESTVLTGVTGVTGVTGAMRIAQEETFGPVVCISRFESVSDAVREANANPLALGAMVFGGDESRAHAEARQLDARMIGVNRSLTGAGTLIGPSIPPHHPHFRPSQPLPPMPEASVHRVVAAVE